MSQGTQSKQQGSIADGGLGSVSDAARKRAVVELIADHGETLRRTARRYSLDAEDADDAYQRALEIALTKAPTTDLRELIRWAQTVTKHEALAVRQGRERLLGFRSRREDVDDDPVARIPAPQQGPEERVERREEIARSREALKTLKPAELRALGLLAEGYSYAEIGAITGFSQTKINRVLAEGRARFRNLVSRSEDGSRCRELQPLLSAYCDGEANRRDAALVREHLRACVSCRGTMRTYRAAPRIAAALAPLLPASRSLLGRLHDAATNALMRLPGAGGGDPVAVQVAAAGGSRGAGMAALAKLLALCAGAAGGAACVATGVVPVPALTPSHQQKPTIERVARSALDATTSEAVEYAPAPVEAPAAAAPAHKAPPRKPAQQPATEEPEAPAGAVEYEPPPPPPAPAPTSSGESSGTSASSGSAAGEFGP